jgi:glycerate kinase
VNPPKIVVAPDKFKGTLTAAAAAGHIADGIRRVLPEADLRLMPVADGGDGTVDAAVAAGFRRVPAGVAGPTGQPVDASFALRGSTAVVELAEAAGLVKLPGGVPAPLTASSYGVGQLIAEAVRVGARRIVLGLGGSACTDGGAGLVQALGGRLLDSRGTELPPGGAALSALDRIETTELRRRYGGISGGIDVVIASDVDNPLLGPTGAAAVYGPQKGAGPEDVPVLDAALARWAVITGRDVPGNDRTADLPGAGAAGGVGFGAMAFLGASLRPGIDLLLDLLGFAPVLAGAALVVTGEGRLDRQTLHGKAPAGVAAAAARAAVPVVAVCGRLELSTEQLRAAGIVRAYPLDVIAEGGDPLADAGKYAEEAGARVARDLPELTDEEAAP